MPPQANEWMTVDEQVAFAWKHRDHFAAVAEHNLDVIARRYRGEQGDYRNGWIELCDMADAKLISIVKDIDNGWSSEWN